MSHLDGLLSPLGLSEYHDRLVSRGFESWDVLVDISEEDMAELGFKLGHRRKLQRAIADYRIQSHTHALCSSSADGGLHGTEGLPSAHVALIKRQIEGVRPSKRRYRRRQPRDPHAPRRPESGYVLFANFLRQNPLVSKLPFVDISKVVGEQWRRQSPRDKTVWMSCAAAQKNRYYGELAEYQQTEGFKVHQERLGKFERHDSRLDGPTSTAPIQEHSQNGDEKICLRDNEEPNTSKENISVHITLDSPTQRPMTRRIQSTLLPHPQPKLISNSTGLNGDNHVLNIAREPRSFHIQALNPFRMVSGMRIRPLLDSFLECVNHCYYLVNAKELIQQFNLAVDATESLSTHTMYTLCLCISVGCQLHSTGTDEMAIMWYENGRRYLDSEDWGWSLNVMRALALVFIFHRCERPTTAHHYLDMALRIGVANNLSDVQHAHIPDDTPGHDWILVWRTIQLMASFGSTCPEPR